VELLGIEADVIDDDDDLRFLALARVKAEPAVATRDDQPNVPVLLVVRLDRVEDRLRHLLAGKRDLQPDVAGALVEALDVFGQAEDLSAVNADALEDAVAVEEAVVVHGHPGIIPVVELAVNVDPGHGATLSRFRPEEAWVMRGSLPRAPRPAARPGRCRRRSRGCELPSR